MEETTPRTRAFYQGAWAGQIDVLEMALRDAEHNRAYLARAAEFVIYREAELTLAVEGKNAEERKANLAKSLQDDAHYQTYLKDQRETEAKLRDAENRASIARNKIRLYEAVYQGWPTRLDASLLHGDAADYPHPVTPRDTGHR